MCPIDLKQIPVSCWAQFEFSLTQMLLLSAVGLRLLHVLSRGKDEKSGWCDFAAFHNTRPAGLKSRDASGKAKGPTEGWRALADLLSWLPPPSYLSCSSFHLFPPWCEGSLLCVWLPVSVWCCDAAASERRGCVYGWVPCGSVWICQTSCQDRHFFFFKSNQIYCHPYSSIQNLCTFFPNSKNELWLNKKTSKKKTKQNQKTQTI